MERRGSRGLGRPGFASDALALGNPITPKKRFVFVKGVDFPLATLKVWRGAPLGLPINR